MQVSEGDYYATLGVDRDSSPSVIKRAYLQLIQVYTPEGDTEAFQSITQAYQTLSNAEKRKKYDAEERLPTDLQELIESIFADAEGNASTIASEVEELIKDWPQVRLLREIAGVHYLKNEDYDDACRVLAPLCDLDPDNSSYLTQFGRALLGASRKDEGVRSLKAALVSDSSNNLAYLALSEHYIHEGQPRQALELLSRGVWADGRLDAEDLPLLIRILLIESRELLWEELQTTSENIRRLVPHDDIEARRYIASQLLALVEFYVNANRPDMLHLVFDLIAYLDPENSAAGRYRDTLSIEAEVWKQRIQLLQSPSVPGWIKVFVYGMTEQQDDRKRTKMLVDLRVFLSRTFSQSMTEWESMKACYPDLARSLDPIWTKLVEIARSHRRIFEPVGGSLSSSRSGPFSQGCLPLIVSVMIMSGALLLLLFPS